MKYIRYQIAMLLHGGVWNQAVIGLIVGSGDLAWPARESGQLFRFGLNGIVSRTDILASMSSAYTLACSPAVLVPERIACLKNLEAICSILHCFRRQASLQRHLAALLAASVSQQAAREDVVLGEAPSGDIGESLSSNDQAEAPDANGPSEDRYILSIMEAACTTYGVTVTQASEIADSNQSPMAMTRSEAGMLLIDLESTHFGWAELQLAAVKDAIAVSHKLASMIPPQYDRRDLD